MQEITLTIVNRLGLHARPAAVLVQTIAKYRSRVKILKDSQEVDGKSIMGIMTLAAAQGTQLKFVIDGEDEVVTRDAIESLVNSGFGEKVKE